MTEQLVQLDPIPTLAPAPNPVTPQSLNAMQSPKIRDHFEAIRQALNWSEMRAGQNAAFSAIERSYAENKKFVIIEAPTGEGKSGIGMAAGSFAKTQTPSSSQIERGAYILSPQKSLTKQYMNDFEPLGLVELKGRSNYTCTEFVDEDNKPVDCEIGGMLCRAEKSADDDEEGKKGCSFCPYKAAKLAFTKNPLGVTNFAYYLNETNHAGQLLPRHMLILDEGHNTENQILGLADIVVNRWRCEEVGIDFLSMPVVKPGQTTKAVEWVSNMFRPTANALIMKWEADLRDLKEDGDNAAAAKLGKKLNGLKRFVGKLEMFVISAEENIADWIAYTDDTKSSESYGCLIIKPLTATLFAEEILFSKAEKIIIMSATIGNFDFFMRNLGIDPQDAVTCRIPSSFPVENRPFFVMPVANMSSFKVGCPDCSKPEDIGVENRKGTGCHRCYNSGQVASIDVAMPKVAAALSRIMNKFGKVKGIVHTHSYKVNKYMSEHVEDSVRVLTHTNAKGDRDTVIVRHYEATDPTVLFSPSMTEGLDLKDELSRFSVIVKMPFAYLDPYVKARSQRDREWYAYMTALAIVQAAGRSNRHKDDKAKHFILDAAFVAFLARNRHLFPTWFTDAIQTLKVE